MQEKGDGPPLSNADDDCNNHNSRYTILRVGTLKDATIVDTTGAGDAFIAGYIMSLVAPKNLPFKNQPTEALFRLRFASWVAGRKLAGPGQQALPNGKDVDQHLGLSRDDVERRLERIVAPPPASVDKSKAIR